MTTVPAWLNNMRVVVIGGGILGVRGSARVDGEFEKKIKDEKQLSENKTHGLVFSCCSI